MLESNCHQIGLSEIESGAEWTVNLQTVIPRPHVVMSVPFEDLVLRTHGGQCEVKWGLGSLYSTTEDSTVRSP